MPHLSADMAAILYTVSAILFILALRGLSSPETSRRGNMFGMVGIAIAILTTLLVSGMSASGFLFTAGGLAIGGVVGAVIAKKIPMTDMPQLVAAFHSLVGMAAVLVALAAFFSPENFGILTENGIKPFSLLELALGAAIGAITFSGSVIAFLKLNGNMGGKPIMLPARHIINIVLALAAAALVVMMMQTGGADPWMIWAIVAITLVLGFLLIIPIGGADMPLCSTAIPAGRRRHWASPLEIWP
jgi:NAD(P) transhydrogenase subunit beta